MSPFQGEGRRFEPGPPLQILSDIIVNGSAHMEIAKKPLNFKLDFTSPFVLVSSILFIISLSDAVMSYVTPIFIEDHLQNEFAMGIVLSTSSLFGLIIDFFAGHMWKNKKFGYFIKATIFTAILFPLCFLIFPSNFWVFFIAMAIWGFYYETRSFSQFNFLKEYVSKNDFSKSWGLFSIHGAFAYLVGPLIAGLAINYLFDISFVIALLLNLVAVILFIIFKNVYGMRDSKSVANGIKEKKFSVFREFGTWKIFLKRLWPFWLFTVFLVIVDSFFWTSGIIYAEEVKETSFLGNFFIPAYTAPSIFMGFLVQKISKSYGKKKTAFYSSLIASLFLILIGISPNALVSLILIFMSSVFSALAFPSVWATYEDYVDRVEDHRNELIGLEQAAGSIAYIVGPILAGYVAYTFSNQISFSIVGALLMVISVICLVMVPKKIKMPHKELIESLV